MPAAEFHKPPARHVEYAQGQYPHGIDEWQVVTIACRSLRKICNDGSVKDRLVKSQSNHPGQNIQEIKMQDVVKERHPPKHQQNAAQPAPRFSVVEQAKQHERWPKRDKQVIERRRILQHVEE